MLPFVARTALIAAAFGSALSPGLAVAGDDALPGTNQQQLRALRAEVAALKRRNASDERQLADLRTGLNQVMTILARGKSPAPSQRVATAQALRAGIVQEPARGIAQAATLQPTRVVLAQPQQAPIPVQPQQSMPPPAVSTSPQMQVVRPPSSNAFTVAPADQPVRVAVQAPAPAPAVATPPPTSSSISTVYQNQNALFAHGFTMTPTFASAYSDNRFFTLNGFLALGAIFLGNINVSRQQSYVNLVNFGTTYGVTPRLELSANVPYLVRTATYSTVGANGSSSQPSEASTSYGGLGDSTFGLFYQAATETATRPNIILNGQVTVPTGRSPYGTKLLTDRANNNLQYPSGLPTGQGVLGVSGGASFVKTVDPMIFFGGLNYYHNIPGHFDDISTDQTTHVPGQAVPGDALGVNFGTAFALNERSNLSFSFQDTVQRESKLRADGGPWSNVVGSGTNAAVLNIGTTYVLTRNTSVQAQLGLGLTQDSPGYQFSVRFPRKF